MPTAHTIETICNGALDIVGERPLASLTDTSRPEARWLARNYTHYVQTALRQNVWNFATEMWSLNKDITVPAYRWSYQYGLPNGWLRVLPLTYNGERVGTPVLHEVRGNFILTSQNEPLYAELIMDRQDPGDWDPLFANVVIARLAHGMAHSLTHKKSYVDVAKAAAVEAYEVADLVNAFEGSPPVTEQHDVIRVRSLGL